MGNLPPRNHARRVLIMATAKRMLSKMEGGLFALFCAAGLTMSLTLVFVCNLRIEPWI